MRSKKQYIVSLLLAIFMIPQVNNAIHYFVHDHHFSGNYSNKEQVQKQNHDHICKQHIFVPSALIIPLVFTFTCNVQDVINFKKFYFVLKIYNNKLFSFYTRGPPSFLFI